MSNTANLGMTLLQPSQAQKHVTVNEALSLLDTVSQLSLESLTISAPPASATDGQGYGVPAGASGSWVSAVGKIAVYANGGWRFLTPKPGWRAYVRDMARSFTFDGTNWQSEAAAVTPNGSGISIEILEFDHTIGNGSSSTTNVLIPAYSSVFGVTGRVLQALGGSAAGWQLGVAVSRSRYGSGLGKAFGDWVFGLSPQPLAYYTETPLVLSATGGTFSGGKVRLCIHLMRLGVPR